jgi:hypothetical protein
LTQPAEQAWFDFLAPASLSVTARDRHGQRSSIATFNYKFRKVRISINGPSNRHIAL